MAFEILNNKCIFYYNFFRKDVKYYSKLEICVVCREFLTFKYVFIVFFLNKSDDYLYLYIRNLENSRLNPIFGTQYPFVFVLAGREY